MDQLKTLRLSYAAKALEQQQEQLSTYAELSFEEKLGLWTAGRKQAGVARLKRLAKLRLFASFGQLIYKESRGLNRRQISELLTGTYLNKRQNILITGPTGAGKIYLACALGKQACNQQISVRYSRLSRLLRCNRYIYMHVNLYTRHSAANSRI